MHPAIPIRRHGLKQRRAQIDILMGTGVASIHHRGTDQLSRFWTGNENACPTFRVIVGIGFVLHHRDRECDDRITLSVVFATRAQARGVVGYVSVVGADKGEGREEEEEDVGEET